MSFECEDIFGGSAASCYFVEEKTCRKVKNCGECGSEISPGERYRHISGKWEAEWYRHYMCSVCVAKWDELVSETGSMQLGCLWEALEMFGENC